METGHPACKLLWWTNKEIPHFKIQPLEFQGRVSEFVIGMYMAVGMIGEMYSNTTKQNEHRKLIS